MKQGGFVLTKDPVKREALTGQALGKHEAGCMQRLARVIEWEVGFLR
jgi:hypothetical protein